MICQILNGDALAYSFPDAKIAGQIIVFREAFIDGPAAAETLSELWHQRATHHQTTESEYRNTVVSQLEKILEAPDNSEFNLWFEYDLFCQVNFWFVLYLIDQLKIQKTVYAVYSSHLKSNSEHFWNGFGPANSEQLKFCYDHRVILSDRDIQFGSDLWRAYKKGDTEKLSSLGDKQTPAFPYLKDVVKAEVDRSPKDGSKGRPETVIEEIIKAGYTRFNDVFREFWKRESIYGFGDTQLKRLYDKVIQH